MVSIDIRFVSFIFTSIKEPVVLSDARLFTRGDEWDASIFSLSRKIISNLVPSYILICGY